MSPSGMTQVADAVATRIFDCGDRGVLEVRIGRPYPVRGSDWHCPIEVIGPMTRYHQVMIGIDPMQSLLHGIYTLATVLEVSREKHAGILNWFGDYERFGLPKAEANRQFDLSDDKPSG